VEIYGQDLVPKMISAVGLQADSISTNAQKNVARNTMNVMRKTIATGPHGFLSLVVGVLAISVMLK
jgi:hypothetical protein